MQQIGKRILTLILPLTCLGIGMVFVMCSIWLWLTEYYSPYTSNSPYKLMGLLGLFILFLGARIWLSPTVLNIYLACLGVLLLVPALTPQIPWLTEEGNWVAGNVVLWSAFWFLSPRIVAFYGIQEDLDDSTHFGVKVFCFFASAFFVPRYVDLLSLLDWLSPRWRQLLVLAFLSAVVVCSVLLYFAIVRWRRRNSPAKPLIVSALAALAILTSCDLSYQRWGKPAIGLREQAIALNEWGRPVTKADVIGSTWSPRGGRTPHDSTEAVALLTTQMRFSQDGSLQLDNLRDSKERLSIHNHNNENWKIDENGTLVISFTGENANGPRDFQWHFRLDQQGRLAWAEPVRCERCGEFHTFTFER